MPERYVVIDRQTPMLLPVDLRDWVAENDLARLILEVVEQCDKRSAWTNERGSGSAQYPPGMMLSLLIYAYARGMFSFPAHRTVKLREPFGALPVRQHPSGSRHDRQISPRKRRLI